MNSHAQEALDQLLEGNRRFRNGQSTHFVYEEHHRDKLVGGQTPIAAVISCVDSRVAPEVIFDLPLGSIFVSRVPANVASDSAKWMADMAVGEFHVPLLIVLGHTGCLAVKQVIESKSGPGGVLRFHVERAIARAQCGQPEDLYAAAIRVNALQTVEDLRADSKALNEAVLSGSTVAFSAIYDMSSGLVEMIES